MLDVLRRLFDFSDWALNHPSEPPPPDMLDASFDAQNSKINELVVFVGAIRRSDGMIANEIVSWDSLDPQLKALLAETVTKAVEKAHDRVIDALEMSLQARNTAVEAAAKAQRKAGQAELAMSEVAGARSTVMQQVEQLLRQAETTWNQLKQAQQLLASTDNDYRTASAYAEQWAKASADWAEWMPDSLPDDTLKIMDVSGSHWSSKWWSIQAQNAFGRMTGLYLGAWPEPPLTGLNGGELQQGSIYFDTDDNQMYIWDGSTWQPLWAPQRAATATLYYIAAIGQVAFVTSAADINGDSFTMSAEQPEGVDVHINGVRLAVDKGSAEGDYLINPATSTITMNRPLRAGDMVMIDFLVPPAALTPVIARISKLKALEGVDGVKKTFDIFLPDGTPAVPANPEGLLVSVDGVVQEPGTSYQVGAGTITFTEAPQTDSRVFISWFLHPEPSP